MKNLFVGTLLLMGLVLFNSNIYANPSLDIPVAKIMQDEDDGGGRGPASPDDPPPPKK